MVSGICPNMILASRNCCTTTSLAALKTAGAPPPAFPASTPSENVGKSRVRTASKVNEPVATGSKGSTPSSGKRSGCVNA